jgi:sulfate adenylyltransferase subunit 1
MDLLRFSTIGSVDDGKSTLIGRLLYDTNSIAKDQVEAVIKANKKRGNDYLDLALLTDGLIAERQQGITIDVSYKYFSSSKRKYIISDCPGHVEYTRNMVTGISESKIIVLLIDASKGILEQTKRHFYIAKMMGITDFVICINKMDLVDNSQTIFNEIKRKFLSLIDFDNNDIVFIPTSALKGDNIVKKSTAITWYNGLTVYEFLENFNSNKTNKKNFRFPVQNVIRNQSIDAYRGFSGRVDSGSVTVGDVITVYPSARSSKVVEIDVFNKKVNTLNYNEWGTLLLENEIDISRGDLIVKSDKNIKLKNEISATICWMDSKPFSQRPYILKHGTSENKCKINNISGVLNINNLEFEDSKLANGIKQNQIVKASVIFSKLMLLDAFSEIKRTGCFILIDPQTNLTVASGTID